MKALFICSMAKYRSRTAAITLRGEFDEVRYAGTDRDAVFKVSEADLEWADIIICMENHHRSKLRRKWSGYSHKMQVWNIPDIYDLLDDELCHILRKKCMDLLES